MGEDSATNPRRTAIFAKHPHPGRVKTRLCPPLSSAEAACLAEGMLQDAVERCLACPQFRTVLFFTPARERAWFRRTFPGLADLRTQRGEGLAERLANAFSNLFEEEVSSTVVAIGSDQPLLSTRRIAEAHEALEDRADVVLGPDLGGGYYLVGLRAPYPELFTRVEMSSERMCAATLEFARRLGLSVELLERGYDVDVERDLVRLRADLAAWRARGADLDADFPRHTDRRLQQLFPPA